jgi:hypothetical protein
MIDEIDYFPRRDQHNKKKDSGWGDLKKQKSDQDAKIHDKKQENDKKSPLKKKKSDE